MTQIHEPLNDLISSNSTYNSNISPALNNYLAQINQLNIPQYLQYSDSNSNFQMGFSLSPQSPNQTLNQQILQPNNQSESLNIQNTTNGGEIPLSSNIDNIGLQSENKTLMQSNPTNQLVSNQINPQVNSQVNTQMTSQQINQQVTTQINPQIAKMSQQLPPQINQQVNQINQQMTQMNPQVTQLNQMAQITPQINQLNPQLSQLNPQMTQLNPQMAPQMVQLTPTVQMAQLNSQTAQLNPLLATATTQSKNRYLH